MVLSPLLAKEEIKETSFEELSSSDRLNFLVSESKKRGVLPRNVAKEVLLEALGRNNSIRPDFKIGDSPLKVLLIGPREETDLPAGRVNTPNYGLWRLKSFLEACGLEVDIFDPTSFDESVLRKMLEEKKYNFIGSSILGPTIPFNLELMFTAKKIQPEAKIVAGGIVPTVSPELLEKSPADFLVLGYGEYPFLDLILTEVYSLPFEPEKIPGVKKRKDGNFSGQHAWMVGCDDLSLFSHLVDSRFREEAKKYQEMQVGGLYKEEPRFNTLRLMGQVYCNKGCSFCSTRRFQEFATGQKGTSSFSLEPENRLKIIASFLENNPEIKTVFISDDDFFSSRKKAKDFFQEVIAYREKTGKQVNFILSGRVDEVDKELLDLAKKAGIILINYGVESFAEKTLRFFRKGITPEQAKKTIGETLKAGIIPSINLLIFHPQVGIDDLMVTVKEAVNFAIKGAELNLATFIRAYYGASILEEGYSAEEINYLVEDEKGNILEILNKTKLLPPEEMEKLVERVIVRRSKIEEALKRERNYAARRAPSQVVQLIFLWAIIEEVPDVFPSEEKEGIISDIKGKITQIFEEQGERYAFVSQYDDKKEVASFIQRSGLNLTSLSPEIQKEIVSLIEELLKNGCPEEVLKEIVSFKKDLFCEIWERHPELKGFLWYLFFIQEKSRFFHLNDTERFFLAAGITSSFKEQVSEDLLMTIFQQLARLPQDKEKRERLKKMINYYLLKNPILARRGEKEYYLPEGIKNSAREFLHLL